MRKNLFLVCCSLCLLIACERTSLSPVEIKIDDGIGGFATVSPANNTYVVKNGETLFDVANKFNIDPMNLAKLNGINAPYNVRDGRILRLPSEEDMSSQDPIVPYAASQVETKEEKGPSELDKKFNRMIQENNSEKQDSSSSPLVVDRAKGNDFNSQAQALSTPRIVSTATGAAVSETSTERSSAAETKSSFGASNVKANNVGSAEIKSLAAVGAVSTSDNKMKRPVRGKLISGFGDMIDGVPNDGINIKANAGTSVVSVADGEVIYAGNKLDESFGNVVVVKHSGGMVSSYANLQDISVKQGSKVKTGQKIGTVGKTGDVTEPQLHFEIMKNNTPLNPEKYLEK